MRREVLEETGLDLGRVQQLRAMPYANTHFRESGRQYITLYFACEYLGGHPKLIEPDKCAAWRWYGTASLPLDGVGICGA